MTERGYNGSSTQEKHKQTHKNTVAGPHTPPRARTLLTSEEKLQELAGVSVPASLSNPRLVRSDTKISTNTPRPPLMENRVFEAFRSAHLPLKWPLRPQGERCTARRCKMSHFHGLGMIIFPPLLITDFWLLARSPCRRFSSVLPAAASRAQRRSVARASSHAQWSPRAAVAARRAGGTGLSGLGLCGVHFGADTPTAARPVREKQNRAEGLVQALTPWALQPPLCRSLCPLISRQLLSHSVRHRSHRWRWGRSAWRTDSCSGLGSLQCDH